MVVSRAKRISEENSHGDQNQASGRGQLVENAKIWKGAVKSRNVGNCQQAAAWLKSEGKVSKLLRIARS